MKKAIFITGAGSGIGRATAELFATRGWFVGLADVNQAGIEETARLIGPENASLHRMDVRDRAQWRAALADFVTASGGRLDVLFNNAGVGHGGPLEMMDPDKSDLVVDVNLKGVIHGAEAGLPHLAATPGARMLNTCSAAGLYAAANMSVYAATKFGVRALTDSLDVEWEEHGIKVRSIMPSFIDTPLLDNVAAGSNLSGRDHVKAMGLEITPVEQVAEAAWRAVHGTKRHVVVGKTAKRLAFMLRWAPGLVARMRPKRGE
ncbi:SDR family oxidoreductase [Sphingomonas sp. MAH-20]|jgi:NAD(P)-dependent dehydrogenase (short-subunit alcohol dehydrogenase family)|uniref:SDR family oxidoreductase n=1 Tax=Sphingomonas horti TaxID=2682842 RepID=A0A6I4J0Q1_9SPHN|nr:MULTISPECIES: SDR family oxidoreductase [Sphingomonas]MBA2920717.1 SDR family oxidoreductase [Sphingomonas sp. CGMCC 1.13658]MVO77653.1 SDR family oxidoreductase [Sphingomonas horti]